MTPLESWVLFGACIAVGAWVYVAVVGGRRYRRIEQQTRGYDVLPWVDVHPEDAPPSGGLPPVRLYGGIYDAEAHGDFHDPIRDHEWCDDCNARLRRAFNRLGDLDLGPRDADMLMAAIRRELDS
jgi:hypothetical protein